MSATDWFRRLFSPSSSTRSAEANADTRAAPDALAAGGAGVSGFASLETAAAAEDVEKETEPPSHPAS